MMRPLNKYIVLLAIIVFGNCANSTQVNDIFDNNNILINQHFSTNDIVANKPETITFENTLDKHKSKISNKTSLAEKTAKLKAESKAKRLARKKVLAEKRKHRAEKLAKLKAERKTKLSPDSRMDDVQKPSNQNKPKLSPEEANQYKFYDDTLKFLKANNVDFYFLEAPVFAKIKNLDEVYKNHPTYADFAPGGKYFSRMYSEKRPYKKWTNSEVVFNGDHNVLNDHSDEYLHVINGIRGGINIDETKRTLFVIGPCIAAGSHAPDGFTICDYIQKSDLQLNVVNLGLYSPNRNINHFKRLRDAPLRSKDIVIEIEQEQYRNQPDFQRALRDNNISCYELSPLFDEPNDYGLCFLDNCGAHMIYTGYEVVARYICELLRPKLENESYTEGKYLELPGGTLQKEKEKYLGEHPDLKAYVDSLAELKIKNGIDGDVGTIVMNCNPFTLGHRYLIEHAAREVDHLIVFVVEEDRSTFPFADRIDLVKRGVTDINNVLVLPSGKFIISLETFPEYFVKGMKQSDTIDTSKDVSIFAKYIAPSLGINKRFVGEEPFDMVTKQYNESMKQLLPRYGVRLIEIERKKAANSDSVISASTVRKLLDEKNWEELRLYVPQTTLDYLTELAKTTSEQH